MQRAIQLIFFSICGIVGPCETVTALQCQDSCNFHPKVASFHTDRKRKEDFANHNDKEMKKQPLNDIQGFILQAHVHKISVHGN